MCENLRDSTSRYDAAEKVMTFLLVCRTCGIERVVETLEYEPRPVWTSPGAAPAGRAAGGVVDSAGDNVARVAGSQARRLSSNANEERRARDSQRNHRAASAAHQP